MEAAKAGICRRILQEDIRYTLANLGTLPHFCIVSLTDQAARCCHKSIKHSHPHKISASSSPYQTPPMPTVTLLSRTSQHPRKGSCCPDFHLRQASKATLHKCIDSLIQPSCLSTPCLRRGILPIQAEDPEFWQSSTAYLDNSERDRTQGHQNSYLAPGKRLPWLVSHPASREGRRLGQLTPSASPLLRWAEMRVELLERRKACDVRTGSSCSSSHQLGSNPKSNMTA